MTTSLKPYLQQTDAFSHWQRINKIIDAAMRDHDAGIATREIDCALCTNPPPWHLGTKKLREERDLWLGSSNAYIPFDGSARINYVLCPSCNEWLLKATGEDRLTLFLAIEKNLAEVVQ
jgi:hypothetical protein